MQFRQLMGEHREAILYVVCGAFTTLVSLGSYALFEFIGIVPDLSNILSWICGVCFAFVVNKWIVFESRSSNPRTVMVELGSFFSSRILTGVIAAVMFSTIYNWNLYFDVFGGLDEILLGRDGMCAKCITSGVEIVLNYVLSKYLVFRKRDAADKLE